MNLFGWLKGEKRATILPNGSVSVSSSNFAQIFGGMFGGQSAAGVNVTIDAALGQPAIWAAVNFLAATVAGLPLHVYRKSKDDRKRITSGVAPILNRAPNDELSSFDWRKNFFGDVLTGGRGFTYIERNQNDKVVNLWPLETSKVTVKRINGRKVYEFRESNNKTISYSAGEIIDLAYMFKADGLGHYGPIATLRDTIGLSIAANNYGSRFFNNGGVPPFTMTGNFQTAEGMANASADLDKAIKEATEEGRVALTLPSGHEIKSIGVDPDKSQLVELKRFSIEDVARMYQLPPTFLQDLTNGTYSNTEQQDLHLVKHTLKRWVEQFEQELNLKLFGRENSNLYVEFNMDGILRGDFVTRMEGYSKGVQNGLMTPNEARARENMPKDEFGDKLMMQGATVPIENQMSLPLGDGNE